jgi:hypothetical protein
VQGARHVRLDGMRRLGFGMQDGMHGVDVILFGKRAESGGHFIEDDGE